MNIDLKQLPTKLLPIWQFIQRYLKFMFIVTLLLLVTFLVFRINQLSQQEPTDDDVSSTLQTVQQPKIDQTVLNKIQQLQDQNVQVQSLFDQARNNPFSE